MPIVLCAARWTDNVTDPDSGAKPPIDGASAAGRPAERSSRRGKTKRNGPARNAAFPAHAGQAGETGVTGRPADPDAGNPARKRKRRRRARAGQTDAAVAAAAAVQPAVSDDARQAPPDQANPAKTKKNRRKNRNRRGLQGRPLSPAAPPAASFSPQAAPSDAGSKPETPGADPHARQPGRGGHDRRADAGRGDGLYSTELYAALDLGTNNCRLLIAQPTRPGQFRVVDAFSRIVRLGEGLGASGRLSTDAMDRAVEALRICASKLGARQIRRMRLIATEACRAAENGEEFLQRVLDETGLELEIINRETEARLAVSGCSSLVGREAKSVVLFDIGGGSSEIAVLRIDDNRASRLASHITHWTSLPVGVVTLSERHGGQDVSPQVFAAMVDEVEAMLDQFDCPPGFASETPGRPEDFCLIGTSGTVTTLAGVHLDLPRYDRRKVDGLWLSDDEVTAMQAKLLSWDFAGRAANPCIGPDRADLVLAGCAILEAIRRRWPSSRMRVADRGLREGLLTDMMADDGVWRRGRPRRISRGKDN